MFIANTTGAGKSAQGDSMKAGMGLNGVGVGAWAEYGSDRDEDI